MKPPFTLAIDQGTTSSRAIIYDGQMNVVAQAQQEFEQLFPQDGWVEHCPKEIWHSVLSTCRQALENAQLSGDQLSSIGITNQRETTVLWHKLTGEPIYNAIVWQDRRTHALCHSLQAQGYEAQVQDKTGLLLDPYFSATKIQWVLDNVPEARSLAENNQLVFGTIDTWVLWNLTGGAAHKTDATNAARTLLFNIHTQQWDSELLALFNIPPSILPVVMDNQANFGVSHSTLLQAEVPITAMIGDQQGALVGQQCFSEGSAKCTYGTGAFLMINTGDKAKVSQHRLLTTVAYRLNGKTTYAMEGSIFMAGAIMQWLRDAVHFFDTAERSQALVQSLTSYSTVTFIPAFTGLGAPHWEPEARGAIFGLTRDAGIKEITAAALQSVVLQTHDLLQALAQDNIKPTGLRVDGGMVKNAGLMQFLADILGIEIEVPKHTESTALGAALLASNIRLEDAQALPQPEQKYRPSMDKNMKELILNNWHKAIQATKVYSQN